MKTRQFISLLLVVVVGFVYLGFRINTIERVARNVDENVATLDGRIVWDVEPKLESIYDKYIYGLE